MLASKLVGREASAKKYDILSALMVYALSRDKHTQRLVMRLMCLITARYNWQHDELSMGQREIARLWSVDQRTVKREISKLRGRNWLILKRAATRGSVSVHGVNFDRVITDTRTEWPCVGPDFETRMSVLSGAGQGPADNNVIPFNAVDVAPPVDDGSFWARLSVVLQQEDASTYAAWYRHLQEVGREGGTLLLSSPSKFHAVYVETHLSGRLLFAAGSLDPSIRGIRFVF